MDKFFFPESMVVIGVSLTRINLGKIILLNNLQLGYGGRLYGIGKDEGKIETIPVFKSVMDLPEVPDVAVIITPARAVPDIMEECGRKGIKRIVIESGGFSEYSDEKNSLEKTVLEIAGRCGMSVIGPNCVGTANKEINMMMAFSIFKKEGTPGTVSAITQSGGIGNTLIRILNDNHIFYRKFVSVGNKLMLDETDFSEYFMKDDGTSLLLMYLEGFKRGRDFFNLAMKSEKPMVILKSNRSPSTARIAKSHTTAISSSDDVVDAAFYQSATVRVEGEDGLSMAVKAFMLPLMKGNRVGVLSRSGGHAVITADACAKYGLEMIDFPSSYISRIKTIYETRVIDHQNPLDLGEIFDYTIFTKILEETLMLDQIDGVIFNHLYQSGYESRMSRTFLDGVGELVRKYGKPVFVSLTSDAEEIMDISKNHKFPTFSTPLQAATALSISLDYFRRKTARNSRGDLPQFTIDEKHISGIRRKVLEEHRQPYTDECLDICSAAGMTPLPYVRISGESPDTGMEYPVALKLLSRDASHKTEVDGVATGIRGPGELMDSISSMKAAVSKAEGSPAIDGFMVQKMAAPGVEFFVGGRQDPVFGPVVLAGYGGIYVEVFKDREIRIAPVTVNEARDMIRRLKSYRLIEGARGREPLDESAFIDIICRISNLLYMDRSISEIDLNPVILHTRGNGASIVDCRIIFR
ncbi:MAG: acetate--CoA ligase family protein [Spirochaetes bacterium]|nr:acetate--CoA ligase family protein [Spirochaetota bacterium]